MGWSLSAEFGRGWLVVCCVGGTVVGEPILGAVASVGGPRGPAW